MASIENLKVKVATAEPASHWPQFWRNVAAVALGVILAVVVIRFALVAIDVVADNAVKQTELAP